MAISGKRQDDRNTFSVLSVLTPGGCVMDATALSEKMRALAGEGNANAPELLAKADALDDAAAGFFGEPQTVDVKSFLGCWARARRLWCDITGEALV